MEVVLCGRCKDVVQDGEETQHCRVLGVASTVHVTCPCTLPAVGSTQATPTAPERFTAVPTSLPGTVVVTASKEVFVSRGMLINLDDETEEPASCASAEKMSDSGSAFYHYDDTLDEDTVTSGPVHIDGLPPVKSETPKPKRAKRGLK